MHCSIIFCNIENYRKIRNFIIPNPEELLCTKAMHFGHFYTEEVKETLFNNGEGLGEVPESGLNLSPALVSS